MWAHSSLFNWFGIHEGKTTLEILTIRLPSKFLILFAIALITKSNTLALRITTARWANLI